MCHKELEHQKENVNNYTCYSLAVSVLLGETVVEFFSMALAADSRPRAQFFQYGPTYSRQVTSIFISF